MEMSVGNVVLSQSISHYPSLRRRITLARARACTRSRPAVAEIQFEHRSWKNEKKPWGTKNELKKWKFRFQTKWWWEQRSKTFSLFCLFSAFIRVCANIAPRGQDVSGGLWEAGSTSTTAISTKCYQIILYSSFLIWNYNFFVTNWQK